MASGAMAMSLRTVHRRAVQHYCVAGHGHGGFGAEATLNVTSSGQDAWGLWPPALSEPWWMVCLVCGAAKGCRKP